MEIVNQCNVDHNEYSLFIMPINNEKLNNQSWSPFSTPSISPYGSPTQTSFSYSTHYPTQQIVILYHTFSHHTCQRRFVDHQKETTILWTLRHNRSSILKSQHFQSGLNKLIWAITFAIHKIHLVAPSCVHFANPMENLNKSTSHIL